MILEWIGDAILLLVVLPVVVVTERNTGTVAMVLPLLVLQTQSHYTLPLGTYMFQTTYSQNVAGIFAYSAMAMLPSSSRPTRCSASERFAQLSGTCGAIATA